MTAAEYTVEEDKFKYEVQDMSDFLSKPEKLYEETEFMRETKYGFLKKVIEGDRELVRFFLIRFARTYEEVEEFYIMSAASNERIGTKHERK